MGRVFFGMPLAQLIVSGFAFAVVTKPAAAAELRLRPATASTASKEQQQRGQRGAIGTITTFPLIPHHVQLERRRRALQDANNEESVLAMEEIQGRERMLQDTRAPRGLIDGEEDNPLGFLHQVGALFQGYGTHYVDLWVGTPPQRQTVIVSTGSKYAAFPCSECDDCGDTQHIDRYYDDDKSATFKTVDCESCFPFATCKQSPSTRVGQCRFSESYQEGSSWHAFEANDFAYLGGAHDAPLPADHPTPEEDGVDPSEAAAFSFRFTFGCQSDIQGLFKTQMADGMLGMCNCDVSFWRQMYDAGVMERQQFSLCFNRQPVATRKGKTAGALTLGGTDVRLHESPMQFAASIKTAAVPDFFLVRIKSIELRIGGGERVVSTSTEVTSAAFDLPNSVPMAILDSGTTDTYLVSAYEREFLDAWKTVTGKDFPGSGKRQYLTDAHLAALPTLLFHIEAAPSTSSDSETITVAFPPTHYMEYDLASSTYTCRIYFDYAHKADLGANFMMGHDIMFDVENDRIGFAESECDYKGLVEEDAKDQEGNINGSSGTTSGDGGNNGNDSGNDGGNDSGSGNTSGNTSGNNGSANSGDSSGGGTSGSDNSGSDNSGGSGNDGSDGRDSGGGGGGGGGSVSYPKHEYETNIKSSTNESALENNNRFCSGWFCKCSFSLVGLWICALVAAFIVRPELREKVLDVIAGHQEGGLYQRTAIEIPMSTLGKEAKSLPPLS
mmetsp:Transcript_18960/g.31428  ORF Transcript_18960/g.31428 Transcript_18960/m.31428 type:complete len:725 (-) Transcript_18960:130-2304(-)